MAYLQKAAKMLQDSHKSASAGAPSVPAATVGQFKVRAHQYSNQYTGTYVLVKKIHIHEHGTWALEENEWNTGRYKDFDLSIDRANVGKYYEVVVEWRDGTKYRWEYQMKPGGTVVDVRQPN